MYNSEKEFLSHYNAKDFEQLSMTTDILLISVSEEDTDNYRKNTSKKMSILLVKREDYPYKDKWCLPGGFLDPLKETLEDCSKRILKTETNLENIYLEQLYTFDAINRDPRCRVVSTSFMALVDKNILKNKLNANASWFDIIKYKENDKELLIELDNGSEVLVLTLAKVLKESTTNKYEYVMKENSNLAFDHPLVIATGLERLRNKIEYTDIVFNMMPEYFTLGELQQVYEVILGRKLLDPAFRRIIANKVVKTNQMKTGGGHRPSVLFKYNKKM